MIVPMKKVTLVVSQKQAAEALTVLQKLGVLHIKHMRFPQAHYIEKLSRRLQLIDEALTALNEYSSKQRACADNEMARYIKRILALHNYKKELAVRCQRLDQKLIWFKVWGNISRAVVEELAEAGIYLRLYRAAKRDFKRLSRDKYIHVVAYEKGNVYFAFFATSQQDSLAFEELEMPSENLQTVRHKIFSIYKQMGAINRELAQLACYKDAIKAYKQRIAKKLEFYNVRFGMHEQEGLGFLQGYCPQEASALLSQASQKHCWGLILEEPHNPQDVPTLIRYPGWAKIVKPVFKFMGTVPGYHEFDISSCFLVFFSLFFAMLIGDAGYGLLFLAVSWLGRRKFPQAPRQIFILIYVLGLATVIWGAISGNWFGFEKVAQLPFFNKVIIEQLNAFASDNQLILMHICFFIGALHLSIAHVMEIFRYLNSRLALAHLGWIAIIWAVYFIAGNLVLQRPLPFFARYLFIAGMVLVTAFSSTHKNIIKGVAISIANLPLKLISSFADTLSYLRLFAVGYASLMVAVSFNQMALAVGFNSVIRSMISAFILLFGHSLNIVLGCMSVLVHGIRLNMLEFSSHLDMEWSGKEYMPFKE